MRLFPSRRQPLFEGSDKQAFSGDEADRFASLVAANRDKLYRVALRMAGNADDAQDLLQDALIEAYRAFSRFREGTYFDKWLYRIMTNTFIDRQRQRKRAGPTVSLDAPVSDEDSSPRDIADHAGSPEERLMQAEFSEPLQRALDRLSPEFRMVLILSDIEEFTYEEIGAMMNVPVGTVRSRLHRARASVRDHLLKSQVERRDEE
jgi:RNA polymerase sigma-70 factor (ECF subfamily)